MNKASIGGPIAYAERPFLVTPLLKLQTTGVNGINIHSTTTNTK
jgi:hypothetical protein